MLSSSSTTSERAVPVRRRERARRAQGKLLFCASRLRRSTSSSLQTRAWRALRCTCGKYCAGALFRQRPPLRTFLLLLLDAPRSTPPHCDPRFPAYLRPTSSRSRRSAAEPAKVAPVELRRTRAVLRRVERFVGRRYWSVGGGIMGRCGYRSCKRRKRTQYRADEAAGRRRSRASNGFVQDRENEAVGAPCSPSSSCPLLPAEPRSALQPSSAEPPAGSTRPPLEVHASTSSGELEATGSHVPAAGADVDRARRGSGSVFEDA